MGSWKDLSKEESKNEQLWSAILSIVFLIGFTFIIYFIADYIDKCLIVA